MPYKTHSISTLLRVAIARLGFRDLADEVCHKIISYKIITFAFEIGVLTAEEYLFYEGIIQVNGWLAIDEEDDNLELFCEILRWI